MIWGAAKGLTNKAMMAAQAMAIIATTNKQIHRMGNSASTITLTSPTYSFFLVDRSDARMQSDGGGSENRAWNQSEHKNLVE